MSYCRFGEGDVYMYPAMTGTIQCCACLLRDDDDATFDNAAAALEHLAEHLAAGHRVPPRAIEQLRSELP